VGRLSEGAVKMRYSSTGQRLKFFFKRTLSAGMKRRLKSWLNALEKRSAATGSSSTKLDSYDFSEGDLVRVRSAAEIQSTLNDRDELKGCKFMESMWQYCGTTQRVLQPVRRFVDERDYRVKRAKGIVLLEGLICHGSEDYGQCDRACFYFWRVEWLESET
jgi:hypothetical protein